LNFFETYKRLTLIVTNLVLILVVDITAGIAYKKINGYAWYYGWKNGVSSEQAFRIKSYRYHHDLAKNVNKKNLGRWGGKFYTVSTNSLGFKDNTNREIPLKSDKKRLVFIGDSFTEGIGLSYEKTFVGLIDGALEENYSILNAGVVSYSPIIYWKKVEDLIINTGLKFDELIVYLDISDINDEAKKYKLNDSWIDRAFKGTIADITQTTLQSELIKENTILLAWLRSLREKERKRESARQSKTPDSTTTQVYTYKDSIDRERSLWTVDEKVFNEYGKRGLDISAKHMGKLLQLLNEHNIKLTVAVYPWPDQIYYDTLESKQVLFWKEWTNKNNVRFINHFTDLFSLKDKMTAQQIIEEYYISGDIHFNEKGNILIKNYFLNQYPHQK